MSDKDKTGADVGNKKQNVANQEIEKAELFLNENNIPDFHKKYTIQTVKAKIESDQIQIIPKLLNSSIKIYRSLYKRIQTRKTILMEVEQIIKKEEEVPENLIDKLKQCTKKIIKDIGHWSKVVGYDERNPQKQFSHAGKNYLQCILTDNKQILKQKDHYADLQYNPLLFKKEQVELQQNKDYLETIKKIIKMCKLQKRNSEGQQEVKEGLDQKDKEEKQRQKLNSEHHDVYDSPPVLKKADLDLIQKYKSLAGSPKIVSRYYKPSQKVKQKVDNSKSRSIHKKSSLDPYLQKLQTMKNNIESPNKKDKSQQNIELGLNLIQNIREPKIRLIAEKVHEKNKKEDEKTMEQQILDVRKAKSITKITFYDEEQKKQRKERKQKERQANNYKTSKTKLIPLTSAPERKTFSLKRNKQMDAITNSLKNLKGKIRESSGVPNQKTRNRTYFKSLNNSFEEKSFDKFKSQIKVSNQREKNEQSRVLKSKESEELKNSREIEIVKTKEIEKESISHLKDKIEQIEKSEKEKIIQESMRKSLYDKKKQLEQIRQDIQNQNIEKIEEINNEKEKQRKIEDNILKKKFRIQELQEKVKEYEDESSNKNDQEDIRYIEAERKKKIEEFENEKSKILREAKEIQERMISQEQKFINLKEKEIEIREADIEEKYAEINKIAVIEMEQKTKKLEIVIEQEERKRKLHERQLQEQVQKNDLIHKDLEKQQELEELLIKRIEAITEKRNSKREKQQQKKRQQMRKEIEELENTHKQVLLEYQRDSQRLGSMFESMRKKNMELEIKVKSRTRQELI